jgi:hypothetical protein
VRRKHGAGDFAACGQRQGLLALDLGSIFEKLLHQKIFNFQRINLLKYDKKVKLLLDFFIIIILI